MRTCTRVIVSAVAVWLAAGPLVAEPTRITVRVLSKGAKFVGTSMGGARVTIHDATTGELLAEGTTSGRTGDTSRIMVEERKPGMELSSEGSASFEATLDLARPRLLRVTAYGPLAQLQAANTVSSTQWVIPGKHITGGDGWLLELPGFAVDVLGPPAHSRLSGLPQSVVLRANLTMM